MATDQPQYSQQQIDSAINAAANKYGVPAAVLYAVGQTESGLNPNEPGGGMFQDIQGGEAGNAIFGGNPENVYNLEDAVTNAAQTIAAARQANPNATWGQVAAIAQRPKDPTAYAATVSNYLNEPISQIDQSNAPIPATLTSDMTTTPGANGVTAGPTKLAAPLAGVDIKNFHGYDLSAFLDSAELGNVEHIIEQYVSDPAFK